MAVRLIRPDAEEDRAITLAALSDPDNPPLTEEDLQKMRRVDARAIADRHGPKKS